MRAFDAKIPDEFNIGTEAAKGKSQKEIGLPSALLVFRLMIASILCGIVPILRVPSPQSTVIFLVAGGAMPADVNFAAWIGIPLAMVSGAGTEFALALAVPLSTLGVFFFYV